MVIQGVSYPSDFEAKKQMIELGRRMDERAMVIAGEGSLSVRVGANAIWITAEGAEKGALKQESFIRVDMNGRQSPGSRKTRLPEDLAVHLSVYAQNPSLRGVIHGYPAGAVALASLGRQVEAADYTPSIRNLGRISLVFQKDSQALGQAAALVCRSDKGILAAGAGCYLWGESLMDAFHQMEALEYYVKVSRLLCAGKSAAENCCQTEPVQSVVSPDPAATPYRTDRIGETPNATVAGTAGTETMEMEGLTPLIRPGDVSSFSLPSGKTEGGSVPFPTGAAAINRAEMMAEVIRRSLSSM